jgi:hypothetical protein
MGTHPNRGPARLGEAPLASPAKNAHSRKFSAPKSSWGICGGFFEIEKATAIAQLKDRCKTVAAGHSATIRRSLKIRRGNLTGPPRP